MKARKIFAVCFACALFLCSCGETEQATTNVTIEVPENLQVSMKDNPYFDTSDLTYIGTWEQNIAIGCEFENPEDNDPTVVYDKYRSEDGEIFCFDSQGRLRKYMTAEYADPYYEESSDEKQTENAKAKTACTSAELQAKSKAITESCITTDTNLAVSSFGTDGEYLITNKDTITSPEDEITAIANMDSYGNLCSFGISYNSLQSPVDYDYFNQKFNAYLEGIKNQYDIHSYDYTVQYEQIGNKVYAIYTCDFEYDYGVPDPDSGVWFSEMVGFTKEIEPDSGDIDS